MSQQDRPLKNNRAPRVFPDGNTGLLAILPLPATCSLSTIPPLPATRPLRATRSSYLLATTISRTKNALPDQLSSSPNHLGTSNNLSSPIVRALDRQSTLYKVHKQGNRHGAPSRKASPLAGTIIDSTTSNLGFGRQNNRRPMHPQPIGANKLPVSSQARPPVLLSRSSLNRLQSSQRPIKRKRATPTKALQQNQSQLLIQNLADIKPFEKLTALEYVLGTSLQSSEVSDDLRRLQLATKVHRNVVTSLAGPQLIRRDGLPQRSLMLQIKDLGLGQLSIAKNSECCSFCKFECNYGSSNPDILLPASASYQICTDCQPTRFFDEVLEILKQPQMSTLVSLSRKANIFPLGTQITPKYPMLIKLLSGALLTIDVKLCDTVLDVKLQLSRSNDINWDLHHLISVGAVLRNDRLLSQYRIGPKSLIEVVKLKRFNDSDITQYLKPTFCSGCPWRQVDVKIAKLCLKCAEEKYTIINHSRHGAWIPFFNKVKRVDDTAMTRNGQGNCMICTNLARMKCSGCPLLVCVNCSVHLDGRCKGALTTLIYSYGQEHIRNDAFLLRSDGAGF